MEIQLSDGKVWCCLSLMGTSDKTTLLLFFFTSSSSSASFSDHLLSCTGVHPSTLNKPQRFLNSSFFHLWFFRLIVGQESKWWITYTYRQQRRGEEGCVGGKKRGGDAGKLFCYIFLLLNYSWIHVLFSFVRNKLNFWFSFFLSFLQNNYKQNTKKT